MKMSLFWLMSLSVATSESPNLQTGVTNMHGHHNLHLSAWSLLEGQYGLSIYSLQPSHWSFTITFLFVHLLIVHLLCNCKHSLLSFIILRAHFISQHAATAVDFILSLALLCMNRLATTHTSICSSYVSTQPPPLRYQEQNVCFQDQLRSFGNHNENKVSFSSK